MRNLLIGGVMLSLMACSTPEMLLDDQFVSQSVVMPVEGRQGLLLNQKLSFAQYHTDGIRRGWTKSSDLDLFIIGLERAKEKYSFRIADENAQAYQVWCASKIQGVEIPLSRFINGAAPSSARDFFSFVVQTKDIFSATLLNDQERMPWYLVVANRDDFRKRGKYVGVLTDNQNQTIEIVPVRKLQNQKTVGMDIVGFEFHENDQVIGAVEVLNRGKVWINKGVASDRKLLLAAASTALLLQNELEFLVNS